MESWAENNFSFPILQFSITPTPEKTVRPHGDKPGGRTLKAMLLLFLFCGGGGLRGLRLGHALLELVHATGRVHKLLRTGVERMANVANTEQNHRFGRAGLDHVAAGATDFRLLIFRVYVNFHNKGWITYQRCGI